MAQRRDYQQDFGDEDDGRRVHLLTHDIRPDFLRGQTVFTKQLEPVSAVLDPSSDMAVFSRKGSRVVKERRLQKERQKQAQEATNAAGTTLGNIMGVKDEVGLFKFPFCLYCLSQICATQHGQSCQLEAANHILRLLKVSSTASAAT